MIDPTTMVEALNRLAGAVEVANGDVSAYKQEADNAAAKLAQAIKARDLLLDTSRTVAGLAKAMVEQAVEGETIDPVEDAPVQRSPLPVKGNCISPPVNGNGRHIEREPNPYVRLPYSDRKAVIAEIDALSYPVDASRLDAIHSNYGISRSTLDRWAKHIGIFPAVHMDASGNRKRVYVRRDEPKKDVQLELGLINPPPRKAGSSTAIACQLHHELQELNNKGKATDTCYLRLMQWYCKKYRVCQTTWYRSLKALLGAATIELVPCSDKVRYSGFRLVGTLPYDFVKRFNDYAELGKEEMSKVLKHVVKS
jgi:hypothetical protein